MKTASPTLARATRPAGAALARAASSTAAPAASVPAVTFSALFGAMVERCPGAVSAYGACAAAAAGGSVERFQCAREFAALRACSDETLAALRAEARAARQ